jgi:hypothetical protein
VPAVRGGDAGLSGARMMWWIDLFVWASAVLFWLTVLFVVVAWWSAPTGKGAPRPMEYWPPEVDRPPPVSYMRPTWWDPIYPGERK